MRRIIILISIFICCIGLQAQEVRVDLPCIGTTKTRLNIRTGPSTYYNKITTLPAGTEVTVVERRNEEWVKVEWDGKSGYANMKYMTYTPVAKPRTVTKNKGSSSWDFSLWGIIVFCLKAYLTIIVIAAAIWLLKVVLKGVAVAFVIAAAVFYMTSWPFWWLNSLQRKLSRPWAWFLKRNWMGERSKELMREWLWVLELPLYILLTPVRFVCAAYFNLVLHLAFEAINMIVETIIPSNDSDGGDIWWRWLLMIPVRIVKFLVIHLLLSVIESVIWTAIDTVLPALTLYHGTRGDLADNIVTKSEGYYKFNKTGHWWVGDGNWAGDGIYFAPIRSTGTHYSKGVVIVCRVTPGKILDLGLAPWHVYRECGNPNAHGVTNWGLNNGYVTGLWWRPDCRWWEFCLYDRKNRYNESWRIRPLYVINRDDYFIKPISGGMRHWLFDKQVIWDIRYTLRRIFD
jgi:hypothetical protein